MKTRGFCGVFASHHHLRANGDFLHFDGRHIGLAESIKDEAKARKEDLGLGG